MVNRVKAQKTTVVNLVIDVDNAVAAQKAAQDPTRGRGANGHITQRLEGEGL
jgi:hypothetical protein